MAKDKKKKKDKKGGKAKGGVAANATKVSKRLRDLTRNPLIADLVAATLVAAAAALKDTKKAHQLAASAEKDLEELGRKGAQRGNALWQLALDVGQKSLDALGEAGAKPTSAQAGREARPGKAERKQPFHCRKSGQAEEEINGSSQKVTRPDVDKLTGSRP